MGLKRIFHPTLNEFRDVEEASAKSWQEAGWRFTNPGHVTAAEGGVGDVKPVTDTYPFRLGDGIGTAETLTTGAAAAAASSTRTSNK